MGRACGAQGLRATRLMSRDSRADNPSISEAAQSAARREDASRQLPNALPAVATSDDDCDSTSHAEDQHAAQHRQKWHARTRATGPLDGGALRTRDGAYRSVSRSSPTFAFWGMGSRRERVGESGIRNPASKAECGSGHGGRREGGRLAYDHPVLKSGRRGGRVVESGIRNPQPGINTRCKRATAVRAAPLYGP